MFGDNSGFLQNYTQPQTYAPAPPKSTFNGNFTQNQLPKTLTFAETPSGNVFLYEVKPLTILLVTPPSMVIPNFKVSNEQFMTPDGARNGIVFYKNNSTHVKALDSMFGESWKANLAVALPDPKEEKSPILLWNGTINNGSITFYLYEYSDKCLVAFTPAQLDSNQVKFCRNLACPHSPSGKCDGWLIYKSPGNHHNYLRSLIGNVDYESKYTKSKATVAAVPINGIPTNSVVAATVDKEPMIIYENKILNESSGIETQIEIYEYSPTSIVLFLTPHALIGGLQEGNNLNHPKQGRRPGFTIAKKYAPSINLICDMFRITDLASRYTMEEVAQSTIDPRLNQQQSAMANSLSNITQPPSINDLPIETLAKSLMSKLSVVTTMESRNMIGGNVMYYGPFETVSDTIDLLGTYEIILDVKSNGNRLCIMKNNDV